MIGKAPPRSVTFDMPRPRPRPPLFVLVFAATVVCGVVTAEPPRTIADFSRPDHGWRAKAALAEPEPGGLRVSATGDDPWIVGPIVEVAAPSGAERMLVELAADSPGDFRCYVAPEGGADSELAAAQLVGDGKGVFRGLLPVLAARMRFRLDPPDGAAVSLRSLAVRPVVPLFTLPVRAADAGVLPPLCLGDDALEAESGMVRVRHDPRRWNALEVWVGGTRMADTLPGEEWWTFDGTRAAAIDPSAGVVAATALARGFEIVATFREQGDPADAATWTFTRRVEAGDRGVRIDTTVVVDRRREVVHLPWITLLAGLGTFGERKSQAVLPGVEYLADEPSSNEREIRGAAAVRRVVDPIDVCFPTTVLAVDRRWLAIDRDESGFAASPAFDSPDRILSSGGHLLGVWSPAGGGGETVPARSPGNLAVHRGVVLEAGVPGQVAVLVRGGFGDSVLRGIAGRLRADPPPPEPDFEGGLEAACRLLAHGWLDSAAREGTRVRHAVWPGAFAPQPAADAPACMLWLAAHVSDAALAARLRSAAAAVLAELPPGATGGVGHVQRPALPLLVRGDADGLRSALSEAAARARRTAAEIVAGGGRLPYRAGAVDYSATLGDADANGYTAIAVEGMLDAAVLCGDEETIRASLGALDLVARVSPAGGVPRGAQPWEMPLHTPDILAAARMARSHLLGHLLDGGPRRLDEARAWALSGVPFVYLRDPVPGAAVGRYSTIGVLGATNWEAPLWIGRPVQWCGLVYAATLHELARVDVPTGESWRRIGRGITRAGLAMTFPAADAAGRGGLLPDYWLFRSGRGDGPAINPATLQATLAEAFDALPLVTATRLPGTAGHSGHVVHVAGRVDGARVSDGGASVDLATWQESLVLVTRVSAMPRRVAWNGAPAAASHLGGGCLAVPVAGAGTLEIEW